MAVPYISEVLIPTPGTASTSWVATGCGYQKYEAVALALAALRESDWVAGIPEGLAAVRVSVTSIPIEHTVKMRDFTKLRERKGGSPKEVSSRDRIAPFSSCRARPLYTGPRAKELVLTPEVLLGADAGSTSRSRRHSGVSAGRRTAPF